MKTTLNLDDNLMRETKHRALETGRTMTGMIEMALREFLRREREGAGSFVLEWPTHRGGIREGVDLADRDALYERMDGRDSG